MIQTCELCDRPFQGRSFRRRNYLDHLFCSIACVEAFEARSGLPKGRVYESRPGWSAYPMVSSVAAVLPC